ncbi:hypothetical protein ACHWQZ_G002373 [Mnemiopsis leidyi]
MMKSMYRSWSSTSSEGGLEFEYRLQIQNGPPWGFRISGGREYGQDIKVSFIKPGGRAAESKMLRVGDTILQINGKKVGNLTHHGVERLISQAHATLKIVAQRSNSTPTKPRPGMETPAYGRSSSSERTKPPTSTRPRLLLRQSRVDSSTSIELETIARAKQHVQMSDQPGAAHEDSCSCHSSRCNGDRSSSCTVEEQRSLLKGGPHVRFKL